jgi:hypothetical protein
MPTPNRAKTEYVVLMFVAFMVLGFGVILAIGKYLSAPPDSSAAPEAVRPLSSPATSNTPSPGPTASWVSYADPVSKFSLRYPPSWQQRICNADARTVLLLAPTTATLGVCNSDFGGQISLSTHDGDQRTALKWTDGYTNITTTDVAMTGATAIRQTATVSAGAEIGPEPGSELVQYIIYKNTRTYLALYTQQPSGPNILADFDLMVKTTLTFLP